MAEAADDIKQAVTSAVNFAKVEAVASRIETSVGIDVANGGDLEDRLLWIRELLSSKKATDGFKRVRPVSDLRIPVKIIFWLAHPCKAGKNKTQKVYKKGYDVLADDDAKSRVCVVALRFLIQQLHRLGQADFKFQVNLLRAPTCRMNFSPALGTGTIDFMWQPPAAEKRLSSEQVAKAVTHMVEVRNKFYTGDLCFDYMTYWCALLQLC